MANTNSNPASGRTGAPSISSTGAPSQQEQVDNQKGSEANPTGKDFDEDGIATENRMSGGPQPTDPVQNREAFGNKDGKSADE